jgi:putative membrane protein
MKYIGYLFILIIVVLGVTFAVLNAAPVAINYYFSTSHLALSVLLAIAFFAGVIIGVLVLCLRLMRARVEARRLRKANKQLQGKLDEISKTAKGDKSE